MKSLRRMAFIAGLLAGTCSVSTSQWVQRSLPVAGDVWGIAASGPLVFAGNEIGFQGPGHVFRSTDYGETWSICPGLPYAGGWSFVIIDSTVIAGSFRAGAYRSSDLGATWAAPDSGMPANADIHFMMRKSPYVYAASASHGILRSADGGRHWSAMNSGLTTLAFLSLASDGQSLYAGTAFTGEVFRSSNEGQTWASAGSGFTFGSYVAALAARNQEIYAGLGSGGIYRSTNEGSSWTNITGTAPIGQVWTLALTDSGLFAGSIGTGVFLTRDRGSSWDSVNNGTALNPRSLWADSLSLFAGTVDGLVCRRPLSEMITHIADRVEAIPGQYPPLHAYPNPFNPSTTMEFSTPTYGFVRLGIFDVLGKEVTVLVSEPLHAGRHAVEWHASGFAGGLYFCRLETAEATRTLKLLLVR